MNLILGVSADGFLAKGPDDKMEWTGPTDKQLFKLLTSFGNRILLAGKRTADLIPEGGLPGREIFELSRRGGLSLAKAEQAWPDSWLIGGPTVAMAALEQGLVKRAILSYSPFSVGSGIPVRPIMDLLGPPVATCRVVDVVLHIYEPKITKEKQLESE